MLGGVELATAPPCIACSRRVRWALPRREQSFVALRRSPCPRSSQGAAGPVGTPARRRHAAEGRGRIRGVKEELGLDHFKDARLSAGTVMSS